MTTQEKMKQPQFNVCSVCKQPFKDGDVIGSCLCGKHEGPHHLGCDHVEDEKMEWWKDDRFYEQANIGEPFEPNIPAIIAAHRKTVIDEVREIVKHQEQLGKDGKREFHNGYLSCAVSILIALTRLESALTNQ